MLAQVCLRQSGAFGKKRRGGGGDLSSLQALRATLALSKVLSLIFGPTGISPVEH